MLNRRGHSGNCGMAEEGIHIKSDAHLFISVD